MNKQVILVSGKINSGKNEVTNLIREFLGEVVGNEFFARPLKELCRDSFKPLVVYLNTLAEGDQFPFFTNDESWFERKNPITRHLLQIVGTEIVRRIEPNYWIDETIKNIRARKEPIITVSDVRFPNEIQEIERLFPVLKVRVNRDIQRDIHEDHISERALDNYQAWDVVIDNNGTLDELRYLVKNFITDKLRSD